MDKSASHHIAVMLSVAIHPISKRPCRNAADNSAIELALRQTSSNIELVHAGTSDNELVLRDYMGMGVDNLTLLEIEVESDPLLALNSYLKKNRPDIVITGNKAIGSEDSGLIPYLLAEGLAFNFVANVCDIEIKPDEVSLLITLPRGKRRRVSTHTPLIVTTSPSGITARQSSYARSRRGEINFISTCAEKDRERLQWTIQPPRKIPKRMKRIANADSAIERLAAIMGDTNIDASQSVKLPSKEAAKKILTWLKEEKLLNNIK